MHKVLAQLQMRKTRLTIELKRVNAAIEAFEDVNDLNDLDVLAAIHTKEDQPDFEEVKDEIAIATMMYNSRMTYEHKIMYVLGKITQGDAKQIADYILIVDTKMATKDIKGLYARVTYVTYVPGGEN